MSLRNTYVMILLVIHVNSSYSREIPYEKNEFPLGAIIDTVEIKKFTMNLKCLWGKDTIIVRKYFEPLVADTNYFRLLHNDKYYIPTSDDLREHYDFLELAAQNCHSYALEVFFSANNLSGVEIFNKHTSVQSESFNKILNTSFALIQEFRVVNRKRLRPKEDIKNRSVLVFFNHYDMISHSVYYEDGVFITKNGMAKPSTTRKIDELLKFYWDTKYIQVFAWKEEGNMGD